MNDLRLAPGWPNTPTTSGLVSDFFEAPTDVNDNYGQRMHGYIIPPVSGSYTFWIASDDGSELWLSSDQTQVNQRKIASVAAWTQPRDWGQEAGQKSTSVLLVANKPYYIAALQKEGAGRDHLAVRWVRPDGVDEGPIPAKYFLPWGTTLIAPAITQEPVDMTVEEGQVVAFAVQSDPAGPASPQWYKDGAALGGTQAATLKFGPVTLADNGAQFQAVLANFLGNATSRVARVTVALDTTPPALTSAANMGLTKIRLNFSEPIDPATGAIPGNYTISGLILVKSAEVGADGTFVTLTTGQLTAGTAYTVTVNGIRDRAATPNTIAAGSKANLGAIEFTPIAIGTGATGAVIAVDGGYDVLGGGADIGGTRDQFEFGYQERTGNFDIRARVAELTVTDPYVRAGLMVREALTDSSRFAAIFAGSAQLGDFFDYRNTAAGAATMVGPDIKFPANYPWAWLRLQRSGNDFNGYASLDGKAWQRLGTVNMALPAQVYFGLAVTSDNTNAVATAKFRDIGPTQAPTTFAYTPTREPLGPSNRRTGLIFSEIMYHPADREDGKNLEFVELYNAESIFLDLSGWRLAGGIDFAFPEGFKVQAGQFVVIAADPTAMRDVYGLQGVLGPYQGKLSNKSDGLKILNRAGAVRGEMTYGTEAPWPPAADGGGHSLTMLKASYGETDPRAWGQSQLKGGSPGFDDPIIPHPWQGVVINEFLARTATPGADFIELYNAGNGTVDLSGCFLTDSPNTNKFRIPDGTLLGARSQISFTGTQLGFGLGGAGETLYFVSADQARVLDAARYGPQEEGVSLGRSPDGGPMFRRLSSPTPAGPNASWRQEEVVINEIMFKPVSQDPDDEYVELYNRSSKAVDLGGWRFSDGIGFSFPAETSIPAGGYLVVAHNVKRMLQNYPQLSPANAVGDFSGSLSGSGEHLALAKPSQVVSTNSLGALLTNTVYITTSEVTYNTGGRWPEATDGAGSSLELKDAHADLLQAASWGASDETKKSQWASYEATGALSFANQGFPANKIYIISQGSQGGEYLIDDVEFIRAGSTNAVTNPGFEAGQPPWGFFGNHVGSTLESSGAFAGANCLHIRASGNGDEANNSVRGNLVTSYQSGQVITIRVKARWLSGWPEILVRLRGNGVELPVALQVPKNLGTPGQPNSQRVDNAGPSISEVTHFPPVPAGNRSVLVTARVSDPDGLRAPRLVYRVDPGTTTTTITMRDDGFGGDLLAGDGIYSASITGRAAGTLVAFHVEAQDAANPAASSIFPDDSPTRECLVRWGDPLPFGSIMHYHMWSTAASEQDLNSHPGLDNKYRDCTLVVNNTRVIYNSGYRNKGSPFHAGYGSYAGKFPADDLLMGSNDHVYRSTGNGGAEGTAMADDMSLWIGSQLGLPYLHSHYIRLYRNGAPHNNVDYDLEYPNRQIAKDWFGGGGVDDTLDKIAIWFEFDDGNGSGTSSTVGATFDRKPAAPPLKLGAYRWNWQPHPGGRTANNYSQIFNLILAANASDKVTQLMNLADMEEWMRLFAWERVLGNWDSWTYNVGQNMYIYTPLGQRAKLIPWDIDFVLGLGEGATTSQLFSAPTDSIMGTLFNLPTYRRMLWRAYQDAVDGPLRPEVSNPQFDARRDALVKNNVEGLVVPTSLKSYVSQRRAFLQTQARTADAKSFTMATRDTTSSSPTMTLTGTAPFAVATIEVNGIPYPVTWTSATAWSVKVPLGAPTSVLKVVGKDLRGNAYPGAAASVTIQYTGEVPQPQDWVAINEIMYNAPVKNAEFIEIFNRHPSSAFDLSGYNLSGASFTFAPGTFIQPNGYLVVAKDPASFASAYGGTIPLAGKYSGKLQHGGETIRIVKPGATADADVVIDQMRYENTPPWPAAADGLGPSLQLIDAGQDNWRAGNWGVTATNDVNRATPGRANANRNLLDPFPAVWINEIVSNNQTGATDNNGEREPWIEIYNAGGSLVDLSSCFLSNDPANLAAWAFPAGTTLAPGKFLAVWADGQPNQTIATAFHTSFRLSPTNGFVALSRTQLGATVAIDYVNYVITSPDRALGSIPDGDPRKRRLLFFPTPGAPNNPAALDFPVYFNEWMASNQSFEVDPVTGGFEDWFEIFNAGTSPVDLSGYFLSNSGLTPAMFLVPNGTIIPAGGYRRFWATGDSSANQPGVEIHTNFKMSTAGEELILSAPDGTVMDSVKYGPQSVDVSQGRYPDGAEPPFFLFSRPTPGSSNIGEFANQLPVIGPIDAQSTSEGNLLSFKVPASDSDNPPQTLVFSLSNPPDGAAIDPATGQFSWTPSERQGPDKFAVTVKVTDNGTPALTSSRTFAVTVLESNLPPTLEPIADADAAEGALLAFQAVASDPDLPQQKLTFSLLPGAPEGASIDPNTGVFSWAPSEDQGPGDYDLAVNVADEFGATATRGFHVRVAEVANPPSITQIPVQSVDETKTLRLQIVARDPDGDAGALVYSLDNPPAGARIDAATGVFTWTPTEAQGPLDYKINVRVAKTGSDLVGSMSFIVGVQEVNTPPTVDALQDFEVHGGETIAFKVRASDSDLPAQILSYSATTPLPSGATIDPATGSFQWQVPDDPQNGVYTITLRVADNDSRPLATDRSFRIVVSAQSRVVVNEILRNPTTKDAEFVELANFSLVNAADLGGWRLEGYDYAFPAGTVIEPNGFLCVARNLAAFRQAYGNGPRALESAAVSLPPEGGLVRLLKPTEAAGQFEIADEVIFSVNPPWPSGTGAGGESLQLIDWRQDHRRVANWSSASQNGPQWQQVVLTGIATKSLFLIGMVNAGDIYIDDISLVAGTVPEAGPNQIVNGGFEAPLDGIWTVSPNMAGSSISTEVKRSGKSSLHVVATSGGPRIENAVWQNTLTLVTNATYTLSYWYLPSTNGDSSLLRLSGSSPNSGHIYSLNNFAGPPRAPSFTPGAPNTFAALLPDFPDVWINELEPVNSAGILDNTGVRSPWIELYNGGAQPLALDNWAMTDAYNNLAQWIFPAGTTIGAKGFLTVWADGRTDQSAAGQPHAGFRLKSGGGSVALVSPAQKPGGVFDFIDYAALSADQSFGSARDGEPWPRQIFGVPTPGASNRRTPAQPSLSAVADGTGRIHLAWSAELGVRYRVQSTSSLVAPNWQPVFEGIGNGGTMRLDDSTAADERYYRLTAE